MVLLHLTIAALVSQNAEAFVTYKNSKGAYKYPSMPSDNIGKLILEDEQFHANLFSAPPTNMDMCRNEPLSQSSSRPNIFDRNRRVSINVVEEDMSSLDSNLSRQLRLSDDEERLALLVGRGGGCTIEDKARNVMEMNNDYGFYNGPKVDFIIIVNDDRQDINREDYVYDPLTPIIDLRIIYVLKEVGNDLTLRMKENDDKYFSSEKKYFIAQDAFLPYIDVDEIQWSFRVFIDGSFASRRILINIFYIFFGAIIAIPTLRFLLLCVIGRTCRWSRSDTGNINGFTWNRRNRRVQTRQQELYMENVRDVFLAAWRDMEHRMSLGKLTEEQIKALPIIEYNVSDIEAVSRKYTSKKKVNNDCNEKVGGTAENLATKDHEAEIHGTSKFLQNAFASCTSCSVCIDEFEQGEILILLPDCGHFFHSHCITPWLKDKKATCPICQTIVSQDDALQSSEDNVVSIEGAPESNEISGGTDASNDEAVVQTNEESGDNNSTNNEASLDTNTEGAG
eukprot:CAMPEP_0198258196 /NCGR_PEP_ID=MMETSP1447-20131203/7695_1 /TAXON_ID=420782 /ORGANISM="Chaetoceros dichaeta, Strain CCMP1751" /LENGTH=507 /DNA_ID=CAMNT_0043945267 /DNA_START=124 /DNA_END=1644 /DNA_ORIENTATION=+